MNTGLPAYSVRGTVINSLKVVGLLQSCSILDASDVKGVASDFQFSNGNFATESTESGSVFNMYVLAFVQEGKGCLKTDGLNLHTSYLFCL